MSVVQFHPANRLRGKLELLTHELAQLDTEAVRLQNRIDATQREYEALLFEYASKVGYTNVEAEFLNYTYNVQITQTSESVTLTYQPQIEIELE